MRGLIFCKQKIALKETASVTLGVPSTAISSNCLYATMGLTTIRSMRTPFDSPPHASCRRDGLHARNVSPGREKVVSDVKNWMNYMHFRIKNQTSIYPQCQ